MTQVITLLFSVLFIAVSLGTIKAQLKELKWNKLLVQIRSIIIFTVTLIAISTVLICISSCQSDKILDTINNAVTILSLFCAYTTICIPDFIIREELEEHDEDTDHNGK